MLKTIRERGLSSLWPALIGTLLALGLMLPVFKALELTGGMGVGLCACLFTAVGCAIAGLGGRFRLIGAGVGGGLVFLLALFSGALAGFAGIFGAAFELIRGNVAPLREYGAEAALLLGAVLTVSGWAMAKQGSGFYPSLSLTMIALLIIWFSSHRDAVTLFAPALIALCAMFARSIGEETPALRTVLASALVVVLALIVSPILQFRSETLEDFSDRLRTYITDTLFFTEPRSVYSIQADGYKPLETRLGGPVDLVERPVMTVETPRSILLRGVIYNEYTGLNWTDRVSSRRYLYVDPRNKSIREEVMDEQRPDASIRSSELFKIYDYKVTMQSDSASTLFVPQRTQQLVTPMELVPYFNTVGEIFITRNLEAGDTYTMSAPVINSTDPRLADALIRATRTDGGGRDMSNYLRVPNEVSQEVYALTETITRSVATPLDTALEIQSFLKRSFPYTLKPDVPPGNQDFVSYFLLTGKEGYCTYFASAMAIMGRIAGLPTRYAEGYIVDPSGGIALVSSKHAHAWAEVYFDGFGWVAFDATPTESRGGPRRDDNPNEQEQELEPQTEEEEASEDEQPQEDEPEPTPAPPDEGGDNASDDPPEGEGEDTEPDTDDQPQDDPETEATASRMDNDKRSKWWIWLLVLLLAAAVTWRGIRTRPSAIAGRQKGNTARLLVWYRSLLGLLEASGMGARPYETPVAYAARIERGIPKEAGFMETAEIVSRVGYAGTKMRGEQVEAVASCYQAVWRAMPAKGRLKWLAKRMIRGIGDIKQVP